MLACGISSTLHGGLHCRRARAPGEGPDGWTRSLDFLVPVKEPELWKASTDILRSTLTQLAGDVFSFSWLERSGLPHRQPSSTSRRLRRRVLSSQAGLICPKRLSSDLSEGKAASCSSVTRRTARRRTHKRSSYTSFDSISRRKRRSFSRVSRSSIENSEVPAPEEARGDSSTTLLFCFWQLR